MQEKVAFAKQMTDEVEPGSHFGRAVERSETERVEYVSTSSASHSFSSFSCIGEALIVVSPAATYQIMSAVRTPPQDGSCGDPD